MNTKALDRLLAQPWAIRPETLAVMTQHVLSDRLAADPMPVKRPTVAKAGVGVLPIHGVLGRGWDEIDKLFFGAVDVDDLMADIEAMPEGQPLVMWFRSPGGIISGIPEFASFLRDQRQTRRITAFTDDLCCSAAYWLAAQADKIIATPTASVGSIGVYIAFYDFTEYLAKAGIKLELFKAGAFKAMGVAGAPLLDEHREMLQADVDLGYKQFTADVLANRNVTSDTMQGQTFGGAAAKRANLVDGFARSFSDFIRSI